MKPKVTRTIDFRRDISGIVIAQALEDVAEEIEERYIFELCSDHDGVQGVTLGIVGKNYSEDIMLTHNSSVEFNLGENYRNVRVDSWTWNQYHSESEPTFYDGARIIQVVEQIQGRLKEILNIENVMER